MKALLLAGACGVAAAPAHAVDASGALVSNVYGQVGVSTRAPAGHDWSAIVGATHDWSWAGETPVGLFTGYWDAAIGTWRARREQGRSDKYHLQVGVTPTLRWLPSAAGFFAEAGIGPNFIVPKWHTREKDFSTTFQFGDHLGTGWRFAGGGELVLRYEHFSNASIKHPNPGQEFLQLRVAVPY